MAIKVRCQQCGKTSQYFASDAGLTALCVACGARFTVPSESEQSAAAEDAAPPGAPFATSAHDDDAAAALAARQAVAPAPPIKPLPISIGAPNTSGPYNATPGLLDRVAELAPPKIGADAIAPPPEGDQPLTPPRIPTAPPRQFNAPLLFTALGGALALIIVLATVLILRSNPTWEDQNRAAVRDLKARAEKLFAAKDYAKAHDAYRELDRLVQGHEIHDPRLRADVDRARADREQLYKWLIARAKDDPATAPTQPFNSVTNLANAQPDAAPDVKPSTEPGAPAAAPPTNLAAAETAIENWPEYEPKALRPRAVAPSSVSPPTDDNATSLATAAAQRTPRVETSPSTKPNDLTALGGTANNAAPPTTSRPSIVVTRRPHDANAGITDDQIGKAIQRAVDHLLAQFADGKLHGGANRNDSYYTGLNALCVYALLQSSLAIKDERLNLKGPLVRDMINKMKAMPADHGPATYARGIRATALALLNRPEDRNALAADVKYLLDSHWEGAYWYNTDWKSMGRAQSAQVFQGGRWDNSNSQYGLLGVWSGAEVGAEINQSYWTAVEQHWQRTQGENGAWDYTNLHGAAGGGRISMTVAGVASLFVTHDYLDAPRIGAQVGRDPFSKPLARGLEFLEDNDTAVNIAGGYTLYGLERVGLASGFKYFGNHDWYRELASAVVRGQEADGSWGGEIETAYHLLFLARGRHPVLMNKLRFDGFWANRPRDVANLARFGSRELERPLNWQVVPITRDWTDWTDSPILYIASHVPPKMSEAELAKIRAFVQAGGLLFTQADGNRTEADQWAQALAKKLFAPYEMKDLPDNHELFTLLYKPSPRPQLRGVSNGARLLMIHAPTDISQHWQMRADKTRRSIFELGMNIFLYASGKADLRNRLASTYIPASDVPAAGGRVAIARLTYPGNWDPEPMAWTRFARYFQRETDVALDVANVELDKLDLKTARIAHWTGTDAYSATPTQLVAIRNFVERGGVLIVEPCGGGNEFYESTRSALAKAFPEGPARLLPKSHPILNSSGPGMDDLAAAQVRPYVKAKGIGVSGRLEVINCGKGKVIFSPLDLTEGLLAANTWGILGFDPNYAQQLMKNLVLWTATGMKDE